VQTLTTRVTELEEERTQLIAARDTAQQEAAEAKSALEKSADLIEANKQLEEKLAAAAKQIEGMESDAAAKGEVISGLNADLDKVRAELAAAQTKLKDDRERFDQLQLANDQLLKEYDEVTGALAAVKLGDVTAAEAKLIQQENEVLRGIIMRQIKEQARREQAYRLAQEEMERLEIRSDTLNDKINQLAKPTLELSAAEQEMLKRPVVTVLHESTDKISAQIEMLKPSGDEATAAADGSAAAPEQATQTDVAGAPDAPTTADAASPAAAPDPTAATETAAAADSLGTEMTPEVTALITEARDQFVRGNFAAAEDLYQKFVELQPNNVVALANLGVSQFRQGKLTAAQLALEKALAVDPKDAFTLTTLGAVMIEQNRIEDAIGYLERANESQADDAITLNYLGVASSQLGQFGKAEQSLRRAITVNPEYAEAHFNLAVIYATAKPPSIALAKRHYEKAIELGSTPDKRLASMLQGDPGS
jgi:tetratricopeptide (TPR) repeat protein